MRGTIFTTALAAPTAHGSGVTPRGFRTHQHRQHVQGDYKQPPPQGLFEPLFEYSKQTLKHPPVKLTSQQRQILCHALIQQFLNDNTQPIVLAIAENHFHLLARFPELNSEQRATHKTHLINDGRDPSPRYFLGRARQSASYALSQAKLKPPSPVWAARPTCKPIHNRPHQMTVARYIKDHVNQDAAVWHINRGYLFKMD